MSYLRIFLIFLISYGFSEQSKFVVVIPSYNNIKWIEKNLASALSQRYKNYRVIYVDDASKDGTGDAVINFIQKNKPSVPIKLVRNSFNKGAMRNLYEVIHDQTSDDEIIVTLDGDDWFASNRVLSILDKIYSNPKKEIWMTYGQFIFSEEKQLGFCRRYPDEVEGNLRFREYEWLASHLRTFYSWLFKKIKKEDLQIEGEFLQTSWDQAIMLPLIEMARNHYYCCQKVLYIYNTCNPISDGRIKSDDCQRTYNYIRALPKYEPLD